MKTKLSNDMKTYLECLDEAAREIGDTGFKNWLIFKLDAEQLEHLERAAVIYAEQSNSHKPVVGGPASASVSEGEQLATEAGDTGVSEGVCCPLCKSTNLLDIDDHYSKCLDCEFNFVGG